MKTLLSTLLVLAVAFSSCESDPETFCYQCTQTVVMTAPDFDDQTTTTQLDQCGLTEADAQKMSGTSTTTSTSGGITFTINTTVACTKK